MILFLVLSIVGAWANDKSLVQPYPKQVLRYEVVQFQPVPEHHFSLEAPQKCGGGRPFEHTPRLIKCQFLESGATSVVLNVCDDKKTYCKAQALSVAVTAQKADEPVRLMQNQERNHALKQRLVPGFTVGAPDKIAIEAKDRQRPVLVMVSTDWCPPCNEAKEYLLNTGSVRTALSGWFKVYVDGDSLASADWERAVPYRYYPSFVALNSKMQEIGRYTGELRQADFIAWTKDSVRDINDPIERLTQRVLARKQNRVVQKFKDLLHGVGPGARQKDDVRLLRWALDQQKHEIVAQVTPGGRYPELTLELGAYRIERLEEDETPDLGKKLELLRAQVEAAFRLDDWALWVEKLCDDDMAACQKAMERAGEREKFLRAREGLMPAEKASMLGEEFLALAAVFDKLKDPVKTKEFAAKCVASFRELQALGQLDTARSAQQNLLPCLEMTGEFKQAETLLAQLCTAYPHEPTFLLRMARLERKRKKADLGLSWVNRAIDKAYGFNWYSAQLMKSDILLDLGRPEDAKKVIAEALQEARLSEVPKSRNQSLVARLRAAEAKIQSRSGK